MWYIYIYLKRQKEYEQFSIKCTVASLYSQQFDKGDPVASRAMCSFNSLPTASVVAYCKVSKSWLPQDTELSSNIDAGPESNESDMDTA